MFVTATDTRLGPETRRSSRVRSAPSPSPSPTTLLAVARRAPGVPRRLSGSSTSTGSAGSGSGRGRGEGEGEGEARSRLGPPARERAAGGGGTPARRKREREREAADVRTLYMPVEVAARPAHAAQPARRARGPPGPAPAPPPAPAAALPSLLAHLSLTRSFPPTPAPAPAGTARAFAFAHPPPPPAPSYRLLHPFHHHQPLTQQTPKRASVGPHPHLVVRTKKRKLCHRFFRSESLLAGPPAPAPPPTFGLGPGLALPRLQPPEASKKQPTWWPSVSRSMGEGRESRLGPAECEWVGEGDNWLTRLQLRFGSTPVGGSREGSVLLDSAERDIARQERALVGPRTRSGGVVASIGAKSRRNRSASSPATFAPTGYHLHHYPQSVPGAPPLKQHLLAVLRMRLSEGGSTSRGGEAGLRFKKWVVWNSWMKRTNVMSDDESDLVEGSDVSDDLEHERAADHLSVDWQDSALHSAHAGGSTFTDGLPLVFDAASLVTTVPSSHVHSHPMELDLPTPIPRPTSPNHLPLDAAPAADRLELQESHALGVASRAEGSSSTHPARILPTPPLPLLARPSARRAHSLPGGAVVTLAAMPSSSNGNGVAPNVEPREQDRRSRRENGRVTGPIACEA